MKGASFFRDFPAAAPPVAFNIQGHHRIMDAQTQQQPAIPVGGTEADAHALPAVVRHFPALPPGITPNSRMTSSP